MAMSWTREQRNVTIAAYLGWTLDAFDFFLMVFVLKDIAAEFNTKIPAVAFAITLTLAARPIGALIFGRLADHFGRRPTLMINIACYSLLELASGFAPSLAALLVLRTLFGVAMGGEWGVGSALTMETVPPRARGAVSGLLQAGYPSGYLLASVVFGLLYPYIGWRGMFMIGVLPALLVLYIRRAIPEPPRDDARVAVSTSAAAAQTAPARASAKSIFDPSVLRMTIVGGLIGVGAHGGYHAITTWLPTYLKTERHLSVLGTGAYLAVIIVAFIIGCMTSAYLQDRIGRRRNLMLFSACCVVTVNLYVMLPLDNVAMLLLGFPLGFFAAGIPATLGALFNELYPRNVRGRGVGFCYNFGRVASAIFPVLVGHMGTSMPLGVALGIDAGIAYGLVFVAVWFLPETRARDIQPSQPEARIREAAL